MAAEVTAPEPEVLAPQRGTAAQRGASSAASVRRGRRDRHERERERHMPAESDSDSDAGARQPVSPAALAATSQGKEEDE